MIPLAIPDLKGNENRYLTECITSNFVSCVGPFVNRFEDMVATASGNLRGVATASGTAGLHAGLVAVGVRAGDLVILPSLTFIASANAINYCGADPWLFDVDRATWNIDCEQLAQQLEAETEIRGGEVIHQPTGRRVAAIMPVHTLGMPADMDAVVKLAKQYELPVVADGAAALGAADKMRPVGALGADLTVFSFNGNKTMTCGGGGMVVGDDPILIDQVKHLTTTARKGPGYDHDRVGFNYRMTNVQAAIGCAQLERIDELVSAKRRIRSIYNQAFADIPGLTPFPDYSLANANNRSSCWFSGVLVEDADQERILSLLDHLQNCGVESRPFWKPIHLQEPYLHAPKNDLRVCEDIWSGIVVLPCSTGLLPEDQEQVIRGLLQTVSN
ncbi:MAG: aminotransferase class I/II-fold pyridoxal phosphate-dependent enzyme [Magnetococcales bacterium]|nr:aminotransferase class I/II-fold pyridoxal phosphate-dependent enzyme [Magnetococcales bacterium]